METFGEVDNKFVQEVKVCYDQIIARWSDMPSAETETVTPIFFDMVVRWMQLNTKVVDLIALSKTVLLNSS